jgi:CBS-domain-containing membrane protein
MTIPLKELTVADLMTLDPVVVDVDASIEEAEDLLCKFRVTGLPVVDKQGRLLGVISQSDLIWGPGLHVAVLLRKKPSGVRVGELMTSPAVTVRMSTSAIEAATTMLDHHVHRLVAVDDHGRPIGVLSATDYVSLVAERS